MPRTNTIPSQILKNPILADLLAKVITPVSEELKGASNVALPFPERGLKPTEAPTAAIASQEMLKGPELKTHLGGVRTGDDSSLEESVRADCARDQNEVANLSGGNSPDSRTYHRDLRGSNFANEDLTNCELENVDLWKSSFERADLSSTRFKNANLSQCDFLGTVLDELSCKGVIFIGARVGGTIIESGDYSGCNFARAELSNVYCYGVNFRGNNFSGAQLINAWFPNCDFGEAIMTNLVLNQVDFTGADLSNVQMSLSPHFIEQTLQGRIPDENLRNLLATIHTIDPRYSTQKNDLMRSVIEHVNRLDDGALQLHVPALVEMLFYDPDYNEVPEIASFNDRLLILWQQTEEHEPYRRGEIDRGPVPEKRKGTYNTDLPPDKRLLAEKNASTLTLGSEGVFDLTALKNRRFSPLDPVPAEYERVREMSLNKKFIKKTLQEAGTGVSLMKLLESIHSIDPAYSELKNSSMRSVIEQVKLLDNDALQHHLPTLVKMLFNNRGYNEVPEIASFNVYRLLPLWLQRKEHEPYLRGEIDRDLVKCLIDLHPLKKDLAQLYGKTLVFIPDETSSGAQTASPSNPAITGGTARS